MYNIYLSVTDQITGCQNTDSIPVELWTRPISDFSIMTLHVVLILYKL